MKNNNMFDSRLLFDYAFTIMQEDNKFLFFAVEKAAEAQKIPEQQQVLDQHQEGFNPEEKRLIIFDNQNNIMGVKGGPDILATPGVVSVDMKPPSLDIQNSLNSIKIGNPPDGMPNSVFNAFSNWLAGKNGDLPFNKNGDHFEFVVGSDLGGKMILSYNAQNNQFEVYAQYGKKNKKNKPGLKMIQSFPQTSPDITRVRMGTTDKKEIDINLLSAKVNNEKRHIEERGKTLIESGKKQEESQNQCNDYISQQLETLKKASQEFNEALRSGTYNVEIKQFINQMQKDFEARRIYDKSSKETFICKNMEDKAKLVDLLQKNEKSGVRVIDAANGVVTYYKSMKEGRPDPQTFIGKVEGVQIKEGEVGFGFQYIEQEYKTKIQDLFKDYCASKEYQIDDNVLNSFLDNSLPSLLDSAKNSYLAAMSKKEAEAQQLISIPVETVPEKDIKSPHDYLSFLKDNIGNDLFSNKPNNLGLDAAAWQGIHYRAAKAYFEGKRDDSKTSPDNKKLCQQMLDAINVLDQLYKDGRDHMPFTEVKTKNNSQNSEKGAETFAGEQGYKKKESTFNELVKNQLESLKEQPVKTENLNTFKAFMNGALIDTLRVDSNAEGEKETFIDQGNRGAAFIKTLEKGYLDGFSNKDKKEVPLDKGLSMMTEISGDLKATLLDKSDSAKRLKERVLDALRDVQPGTQIKVGGNVISTLQQNNTWDPALDTIWDKLIDVKMVAIPGRLNESFAFGLLNIQIVPPAPPVKPPEWTVPPSLEYPPVIEQQFFIQKRGMLRLFAPEYKTDQTYQGNLTVIKPDGTIEQQQDSLPDMRRVQEKIDANMNNGKERGILVDVDDGFYTYLLHGKKNLTVAQARERIQDAKKYLSEQNPTAKEDMGKQINDFETWLNKNFPEGTDGNVLLPFFDTRQKKNQSSVESPEEEKTKNSAILDLNQGRITTFINDPNTEGISFEVHVGNNIYQMLVNRYKYNPMNKSQFETAQRNGLLPTGEIMPGVSFTFDLYEKMVGQGGKDPKIMLGELQKEGGVLTIDKPIGQSSPILWLLLLSLQALPIGGGCVGPAAVITVTHHSGPWLAALAA